MLAQYTDVWIATFNEAEARKLAANPDLTFLTSTQLLSLINNQHQHNKIVNSLEYLVEEFPPLPEKEKVNFFSSKVTVFPQSNKQGSNAEAAVCVLLC